MNFKNILIVFFFSVISFSIAAQSPLSAEEIQNELISRGVSEEEVNEFLSLEGMSLNDLEKLDPSEYVSFNERFNAFIAKKREKGINQVSSNPTTDVEKEVFEEPTQVQEIKEKEVVKPVTIYGEQLFSEGNFPLLSGDGLVPGTYILDVGDEVAISIFGNSQLSKIFTVNKDGAILYNNGRQRVIVAGLSLNDARIKLEKVFKKTYNFRTGDFNANVVGARTITVSIYGEVENSGGYILSAVNSPINAIQAAGGITENGSYRNIKIYKSNGEVKEIDLYKYLNNPSQLKEIGLSNNDVIQVPTRNNTVQLNGSVVRPLRYELKQGESIEDLLSYAGGFKSDANLKTIELKRFIDGSLKVISVDYDSSVGRSSKLKNGDRIFVFSLIESIENLVSVTGEVNNPGNYELITNMKLKDLLGKLIFNQASKLDQAVIRRVNANGTTEFIKVNLQDVLDNPSSSSNVELKNKDELLIWDQKRFVDAEHNVQINGAVRYPGKYAYQKGKTYLSDIIYFAGGLRRDASSVGMIHRKDPLNENSIEYLRFDPFAKPNSASDLVIMPFDSIVVLSDESITDNYSVVIEGEVKNPGSFKYGRGMSVKDLVVLSGGFKIAALTNEVEVSRLIIKDNKPTEVKIATLSVDRDLTVNGEGADYILEPFDRVYVRTISDFENQTYITLEGEVKFPGNYVLLEKNEKLSSVIKRAGGITEEGFVEGARLLRSYDETGLVITNLDQAMKYGNSKFNYILKPYDQILIPKKQDIVTIKSNLVLRKNRILQEEELSGNSLSIAHFPNKRADYYIEHFAGGFDDRSDKKNIYVEHPNGEIEETRNFGFFNIFPKVRQGSTIIVPDLPLENEAEKEKEDIDWNKLLTDSVTQAMSIITLLLLIERI